MVDTAASGLLAAARAGDGEAFRLLVGPHLRALHVHCYRMLGSLDDADEAIQEALLRAWRGLETYQGHAPLLHWLYRITTTTSLRLIEQRSRRPEPAGEISHLQPYPDHLLDQLVDTDGDPAAVAERRESVALAFITALQLLPASQRAVLILRDVLAWSAREVATLLDTSTPAVNSALQRARTTLSAARPAPAARLCIPLSEDERRVLNSFVDAWQRCDIPAIAALLRADVILTMPPQLISIIGRDRVIDFLATVPAGGRLDLIRLVHTRANGQPALAAYLPDVPPGSRTYRECQGYGIMVFAISGGSIAAITGFPSPGLFGRFGLPATMADQAS
jgi:RNA polymerase sigma-70 factor (ECF subfamily)